MSTFRNKNSLRIIEAQIVQKLKNDEARPKFTGSYGEKKRVLTDAGLFLSPCARSFKSQMISVTSQKPIVPELPSNKRPETGEAVQVVQ